MPFKTFPKTVDLDVWPTLTLDKVLVILTMRNCSRHIFKVSSTVQVFHVQIYFTPIKDSFRSMT